MAAPKLGTRWPVNQELYNTLARAQGDMHTRVIVPKPWYTGSSVGSLCETEAETGVAAEIVGFRRCD